MKKITIICIAACVLLLTSCADSNDLSEGGEYYNGVLEDATYDSGSEIGYKISENSIVDTTVESISTFSVDVDTAGYSIFRKYVSNNQLPPSSVRTEEMVNYFDYQYDEPVLDQPFGITTEFAPCPWNENSRLLMIGIKGKDISYEESPANNLVLLIDVSGSMGMESKLPVVKESIQLLVNSLREQDTISIVTYASNADIVLNTTNGDQKEEIMAAVNSLETGGSTNGSDGIGLAYDLAYENFNFDGNNRVLMFTDGDFNVGATSGSALTEIVKEKSEIGIYLTILSYGSNFSSIDRMEELSNDSNGTYYFIDTMKEAEKVLVHEIQSAIVPIADDVKVQIEFDSTSVKEYRLIGYENRTLSNDDFDNDDVDAGDLGAGHTVTAFYEVTMNEVTSDTVATVRLRYKDVGELESKQIEGVIRTNDYTTSPSIDFKFASAVVEVSLLMRDSSYKGFASYESALERIEENLGEDPFGFRQEFYELVSKLNN